MPDGARGRVLLTEALRLYQNFGFEEVDTTTVLGVAL